MSRADARPAGWPREAWIPPTHYPTGPHRWAIYFNGYANTWICLACGATPAVMDVRSDCPEWDSKP